MRRVAPAIIFILSVILAPLIAEAQQEGKVYRIGFLRFGPAAASVGRVEALRTGLRELGYVEGKNIVIEFRYAETAPAVATGSRVGPHEGRHHIRVFLD
jgi:hypothetical protein